MLDQALNRTSAARLPGAVYPGRVAEAHPDTSREAARSSALRNGSVRMAILGALQEAGAAGLNAWEASQALAEQDVRVVPNHVVTRLWELCRDGFAERLEVKRPTGSGRRGHVYRATAAGMAWRPARGGGVEG